MARKKRVYDDDDGRTIADMGGVERQNLIGFRVPHSRMEASRTPAQEGETPPARQEPVDKETRRIYVFAALRAALLIAGVFIVAIGLAILIMVLVWKH